jgi:maltose O-acetyltransferase
MKDMSFGAGQLIDKNQVLDVSGDIIIRNGAYIGGNSIIRYGVEIGERSVVAAGSVVVKDVPTRYVVGGNPAKPLRSIPKF